MEVGDKERRARPGWFILDGGRQGQLGFILNTILDGTLACPVIRRGARGRQG
jgi:hypothetical protein